MGESQGRIELITIKEEGRYVQVTNQTVSLIEALLEKMSARSLARELGYSSHTKSIRRIVERETKNMPTSRIEKLYEIAKREGVSV